MFKITQPKIYPRGKKLWVRFSLDNENIRRPLYLDDTKENRKLANLKIIPQILLKVYDGTFFENESVKKVPTVEEYIEKSLALHKGSRAPRTNTLYKQNYDLHIKKVFGKKRLDKITGNDITHWQNDLRENKRLVKNSILRIRSCLHTLFEDAIAEDIIQANPIRKAMRLRETENPLREITTLQPFNKDEIKALLDALDGSEKNLLATLFYTGMRAGELIGLKWKYVDFENRKIFVREQMTHGVQKTTLKSKSSNRAIPIIDILLPYLQVQYMITGEEGGHVFLTERSKKPYHDAGKVRSQIWLKAMEKTNVPYRNLHQTRGTFISTLISNGEDITYVSKIAGHDNLKVTLENYSEYIPVSNSEFGKCFEM